MVENKALSTLATEALKPASKWLDALLAPKLQRVQTWAKKKELRDRVEDKVVQELLDRYWKQVLTRASGISTIVFQNKVIPITSIYEPLKLELSNRNSQSSKALRHIVLTARDLKPGENYLIIDSAGMGKSTFSKHLVLDMFSSSIKQPLFLELRRVDDSETLLGRIAKDIDEDQEDVNEEVLRLLLKQGNYVIVLDGYDELSDHARKRIGMQIADLALKYEKNSIILTSRPEVTLPEIPNSMVYNIQPLERSQAESLVLRYDALSDHTVGKGLIGEFDHVSGEFLKTPLLLVLLYRTYSVNQTIATNVTTFYNDVYYAFYRGHDLTKSGFSRTKSSGLGLEGFRRLLRATAFLLLTENKYGFKNDTEAYSTIEKAMQITSIAPSSIPAFLDDLLTSVPLFIRDGNEFRFIHKSLCEFFAAEYLASAPSAEKKIEIIRESRMLRSFRETLDFLAELNPSLYKRSVLAPIARAYLSAKDLLRDPVFGTLDALGITHLGIGKDPEEFSEKENFWVTSYFSVGDTTSHLIFIGKSPKLFPSLAWTMLCSGEEFDFNYTGSTEQGTREKAELLAIKSFVPLIGKTVSRIKENSIFCGAAARVVAHLMGVYSDVSSATGLRVLDKGACKKLLKQIREEQRAQNQIDALLSRA